jgi:diaminopimelate epimerase
MHGLGNDFVIVHQAVTPDQARAMADRRYGIGCDQVLTIEPARSGGADFFMRIYNPDGSEAEACGNGTRCAADLWMREKGRDKCVLETKAGLLSCERAGDMVKVDMGAPRAFPPPFEGGIRVDMGNPHCVFFVRDAASIPLTADGPKIENHTHFPNRTNVEFAQILAPDKIRVRVWERGAGITQARGSGACAVLAAAVHTGQAGRRAEIVLDGGSLFVEQREGDDHILMAGPAASVFAGEWQGG